MIWGGCCVPHGAGCDEVMGLVTFKGNEGNYRAECQSYEHVSFMRRDRRILRMKPASPRIAESLAVQLLHSARGSEASCHGKTSLAHLLIVPSETLNTAGESAGVLDQHGGAHTTVAHFM